MLERKTFTYKDCIFSERNREDVNYSKYQDKVRAQKIKFINEVFANDPNEKLALLLAEMRSVYSSQEISSYIDGSTQSKRELVYDSFKVKDKRTFAEFNKLFTDEEIKEIYSMLTELEYKTSEDQNNEFDEFLSSYGNLKIKSFVKDLDQASINQLYLIARKYLVKKKMKN